MIQDNDRLDRLLRDDASAVIADDGFTARVLRSLAAAPVRAPAPAWLTPLLMMASVTLGSLLAFALAPADANIAQGFVDLLLSQRLTMSAVATLATTGALLATAIVLAATTD